MSKTAKKNLVTFWMCSLFCILTNLNYGQTHNRNCYDFMDYEQNENFTDTTFLTNGAKLYYQWNCDSTWLTFEKKGKKLLKSIRELDPIMSKKIGLNFIKEYPKFLLFKYKWSCGSFSDSDIVLINKNSGSEIDRIPYPFIVISNIDNDFSLFFENQNYTTLIYFNHANNKKRSYKLKQTIVDKALKSNSTLFVSDLITDFSFRENLLQLTVKTFNKNEQSFQLITP